MGGSCPGCGGKGHSSPSEGAAHILGCGANTFPEFERHSPFTRDSTHKILTAAVREAASDFKVKITDENAGKFASLLAGKLLTQLRDWCTKMEHQKFA